MTILRILVFRYGQRGCAGLFWGAHSIVGARKRWRERKRKTEGETTAEEKQRGFSSKSSQLNSKTCWWHTPLARKIPFLWISIKNKLLRAARETSKFQNLSHLSYSRCRNMAVILPIWRKILFDQSINILIISKSVHDFLLCWLTLIMNDLGTLTIHCCL